MPGFSRPTEPPVMTPPRPEPATVTTPMVDKAEEARLNNLFALPLALALLCIGIWWFAMNPTTPPAPAAAAAADSSPAPPAANKPMSPVAAATSAEGTVSDARCMAEEFVKKRLKAPSTADFPNPFDDDVKAVEVGSHKWVISGYVDAQNSFGAKLRSDWACTLHWVSGQTWQADDVTIFDRGAGEASDD